MVVKCFSVVVAVTLLYVLEVWWWSFLMTIYVGCDCCKWKMMQHQNWNNLIAHDTHTVAIKKNDTKTQLLSAQDFWFCDWIVLEKKVKYFCFFVCVCWIVWCAVQQSQKLLRMRVRWVVRVWKRWGSVYVFAFAWTFARQFGQPKRDALNEQLIAKMVMQVRQNSLYSYIDGAGAWMSLAVWLVVARWRRFVNIFFTDG